MTPKIRSSAKPNSHNYLWPKDFRGVWFKDNPEEELDFGIDVGSLGEAERPIYDKLNAQMRTAWLKKTSELANTRKGLTAEQEKVKADLEEAQQALAAWNDWYQREGQYLTPKQQAAAMREEGLENPNALVEEISTLRREFGQAAQQYNQVIQKLQQDNQAMQQAFGLHNQLINLQLKHPDLDTNRLLETAKDRGIKDLDLAYQLAYGDEIRTKSVEEEVNKRLTEEREKIQTEKDVVDTKPSTVRYAPPGEAKSYSEAGANLLGSIRKAGVTGTITD
jgi:hypothetical protein